MNRKPRCVVVAYNEDTQEIETCTVDRAALQRLRESALVMPWSLEENGFRLDDEFARKLGGVALLLLATGQPELNSHIAVTRDERSDEEAAAAKVAAADARSEQFVARYDKDSHSIVSGFVPTSALDGVRLNLQNVRKVSEDHPMDDELARRLGVQALHMFAALNPDVKDLLHVTNAEGEALTIWDRPPKP